MDWNSKLRQDITIWSTKPDGFGGYTFLPPTVAKGRFEDKAELFYSSVSGREVVSQAVMYTKYALQVGDFVKEGFHVNTPDPLSVGARQIQAISRTPDLRALDELYKGMM